MKQRRKTFLAGLLSISMLLGSLGSSLNVMATASNETASEISNMTINYQTEPLGIATDNLRFGWQMQSNRIGIEQISYRIVVSNEDSGAVVWDSGEVQSGLSNAIPYGGDAANLELETRYNWTVTVTDSYGGKQSASSWFETGTDWDNAQWITSQGWTTFTLEEQTFPTNWGTKTEQVAVSGSAGPLFRTERALQQKEIAKARLYITSLGTYEAYINGRQVQKEVNSIMNPGWTDFSSYVNYQTYDVTDYLAGGEETVALSAVVAGGWYDDIIGNHCNYESAIGQKELREHALYANLLITYEDGEVQSIVTDDSWNATDDSFLESAGVYSNVSYNNQRAAELEGWTETGFDTAGWDQAASLGQANCDVRPNPANAIEECANHPYLNAYTYTLTDDSGSVIADASYQAGDEIPLSAGQKLVLNFGQNASHTPHFVVSGAAGTELFLQPAELVNTDGTINTSNTNLRSFQYTLSGAEQEDYFNEFSFVGYQYLEVTATSDVVFHSFDSVAMSSLTAEQETGSIETSNELINQFIRNSKWSQMSNYCSVPTDCPTREYLGWSGDAQLFCESAMFHYDSAAFLENYMEIMNDFFDQRNFYGDVMPYSYYFGPNMGQSCGWGDAGIIIPYYFYLQTGDKTLIEKYWPQMSACVNSLFSKTVLEPDKFAPGYSGIPYGDWAGIQISGYGFVSACFTIYTNELMAEMADLIGQDSATFAEHAQKVREYTIDRFIDEEGNVLSKSKDGGMTMPFGTIVDNAQTAVSWALKLGLYRTEKQKQTMKENLAASVANKDGSVREDYGENTIATGFLGVNILMPSLSESGEQGTAYDLMNSTNIGSFLYSVSTGSTSIWETWTGGSRNHYSYGAASEWLYEYAAGIQKDAEHPGFKQFILQPQVDDSLTYLNGSYHSYYGTIVSNWTADQGKLTSYKAVVPANTTATLYLPVSEKEANGFKNIDGVTFMGMEEHNGQMTAKFSVRAGGYSFTVENGRLSVSVEDGYETRTTSDKTILRAVLAYAEAQFNSDEFDHVIADVQSSYTAALENARAVDADLDAEQGAVDAAWKTLMTEIHKLGFVRGDKTNLGTLIETAKTFMVQIDLYTPATAEPFTAALQAAQTCYDDGNAMETDVAQAQEVLLDAMVNLRFKADKSILEQVLAQASSVDLTSYSQDSVQVFLHAKEAAEAAYGDVNAEQQAVNEATDNLKAAMEQLSGMTVEVQTPAAPVEGDTSVKTNGSAPKTGETTPIAVGLTTIILAAAVCYTLKKRGSSF